MNSNPEGWPKTIASSIFALWVISVCCCAEVFAQQFGLQMGETVQQVRSKGIVLEKARTGWKTRYLPYGNTMFDDYRLLFGPNTGLCRINAWISEVSDSGYGDKTKQKYDSLKEALNKRYGYGSEIEHLREGALWKENHEWMWSLFKDERWHSTYWGVKGIKINQKNLKAIKLEAKASSPSSGMIAVNYEFNNITKCLEELNAVQDSNL